MQSDQIGGRVRLDYEFPTNFSETLNLILLLLFLIWNGRGGSNIGGVRLHQNLKKNIPIIHFIF